jgi:hypothetical protein
MAVHEKISRVIAAQVAITLQRTQVFDSQVLSADLDRLMLTS